jgi:NADH-quinone oxidoreductase subunit G
LNDKPGVSPHDCVGANLNVQVQRNKVMRVLPRENEEVNEIWLADRDRFSYEALNSSERLHKPMIRENGAWRETDWSTALNVAVDGMQKVIAAHGPQSIGALASPTSTVEEFYLLQKLVRALGSGNVDHRLRQRDFSDDADAPLFPYIGLPIRELETVDAALLIGSNIRKDQPLLGLRLRKAFLRVARLFAVNPVDYDFSFDLQAKVIVDPAALPAALARIASVLAESTQAVLPPEVTTLAKGTPSDAERVIAAGLKEADNASVLVGNFAMAHPQAALLRSLADLVAELSGARLGLLPEANGAGGWLAGCLPQRAANGAPAQPVGRNAQEMFAQPLMGYFIFGAEPELDSADGKQAQAALKQAGCVVAFSAFKSPQFEVAHVLLPLAPFTETDGTFVNAEGRFQSFNAAVTPAGEARPGWKILRVLGNLFKLDGFDYTTSAGVLAEIQQNHTPSARPKERRFVPVPAVKGLQRIAEVPMYSIDPLVRRATALQETRDNTGPVARMHPREAQKQGVGSSARLRVIAGGESVTLDFLLDRRIPEGCVSIPAGCPETLALGGQDVVHVEVGQ